MRTSRDIDAAVAELRQRLHLKDLAAQERRYRIIAQNEAARVARGEPKQPPYVYPPDWDAYKARAAHLIATTYKVPPERSAPSYDEATALDRYLRQKLYARLELDDPESALLNHAAGK